jgi:hypothetical protein
MEEIFTRTCCCYKLGDRGIQIYYTACMRLTASSNCFDDSANSLSVDSMFQLYIAAGFFAADHMHFAGPSKPILDRSIMKVKAVWQC